MTHHGVLPSLLALTACVTVPKLNTGRADNQRPVASVETDRQRASVGSEQVEVGPERPSDSQETDSSDNSIPVAESETVKRWRNWAAELSPAQFLESLDEASGDEVLSLADLELPEPAQSLLRYRQALIRHHRGLPLGLVPTEPPGANFQGLHDRVLGLQLPPPVVKACLLLPLDKPMGQALQQSFLHGLGEASQGILVEVASSEDPIAAVTTFAKSGCPAVITGPYLARSQKAAQQAALLGLPLISMGRDGRLPGRSPWLFQVGLPNEHQIQQLVKGAIELRGYRRFALLFPRSRSGWEAAESFVQAVLEIEIPVGETVVEGSPDEDASRKPEVVYIQPYAEGERTFTSMVEVMVGRDRASLNRRRGFRKCVSEISEEATGLRKKRAMESCRDHTPPAIDFDAIFVPDDLRTVRQLMAFLEQSDMVASLHERALWKTRKATSNPELQPTPILGLRQLNSDHLAKRTRFEVDGTLFIDAFHPWDKGREMPGQYARSYFKKHKRKPGLLEAIAFDLGRLVTEAQKAGALGSRNQIRDYLAGLKDFDAVTGPWTMGVDGQVRRDLYLLSIHRRQILTEAERRSELEKQEKKKRRRGR